jgi:hypothetical protein
MFGKFKKPNITKILSFNPKISKNRYEILFFNKENFDALINILKNPETQELLQQQIKNLNKNNLNKNKLGSNQLNKISIIANTTTTLNNKSNPDYKNLYPILKETCYSRMYFRYTDDNTLSQRFKKKSEKNFNYVKYYNSSIFYNIIKSYYNYIFNYFLQKKYRDEIIRQGINNFANSIKELDKTTKDEINNILNDKNESFNEEKHYENIKKVLKIIKEKTNGYINYCIIFDIKKKNIYKINNIIKKINMQIGGENEKNKNNKKSDSGYFYSFPSFEIPEELLIPVICIVILPIILVGIGIFIHSLFKKENKSTTFTELNENKK